MSSQKNDATTFAQWIDSMGQKEIADAVGVEKAAVWNWRHGINQPRPRYALKLIELANGALALEDIYGG